MLRGLRDSLTGDLHAGVAVWAVDGVSRRDLTSIANATEIDEMEDVARLPYCAAVPPPYSADAETYSNHFCVGDPPAVQDEDHAYDLRHDASQVWGLTTGTYYAQALLRCHDALIPQNDAFRLCVVVTDGQIDEDRYAQCDDDVRRPTMTYTANMTGDYYDAGTEIFKDDNGACGWHASVLRRRRLAGVRGRLRHQLGVLPLLPQGPQGDRDPLPHHCVTFPSLRGI